MALAAFAVVASSPAATAGDTMAPVLDAYFQIHDALARDQVDGVGKAAATLAKVARALPKPLGNDLAAAAAPLQKAGDLASSREAFKALSARLATWAESAARPDVKVLSCSMAGARWLQRAKDAGVRNPYYGAEMLACGEVVKMPAAN